jgi:hypothetical protein
MAVQPEMEVGMEVGMEGMELKECKNCEYYKNNIKESPIVNDYKVVAIEKDNITCHIIVFQGVSVNQILHCKQLKAWAKDNQIVSIQKIYTDSIKQN